MKLIMRVERGGVCFCFEDAAGEITNTDALPPLFPRQALEVAHAFEWAHDMAKNGSRNPNGCAVVCASLEIDLDPREEKSA